MLLDKEPDAVLRYVNRAKPCIGPLPDHPKVNQCNHFDFIAQLQDKYPHQIVRATELLADKACSVIVRRLLREFPFARGFSPLRKRAIVKVLETRERLLREVLQEGRMNI